MGESRAARCADRHEAGKRFLCIAVSSLTCFAWHEVPLGSSLTFLNLQLWHWLNVESRPSRRCSFGIESSSHEDNRPAS